MTQPDPAPRRAESKDGRWVVRLCVDYQGVREFCVWDSETWQVVQRYDEPGLTAAEVLSRWRKEQEANCGQ